MMRRSGTATIYPSTSEKRYRPSIPRISTCIVSTSDRSVSVSAETETMTMSESRVDTSHSVYRYSVPQIFSSGVSRIYTMSL